MPKTPTLFDNLTSKNGHAGIASQDENEYQDVKRLGRLPQDWSVRRIEDCILRLDAGTSVGGEDRETQDGEKGILKVSAVSSGRFRPSEHKVIATDRLEEVDVQPKKDRLIISRANTRELVGASAYVEADHPDLYLPDKLWQIRVDERHVLPRWLHHILWTRRLRFNIGNEATGSSASMKNISQKRFKRLRIPVPPLEEQRQILNHLGTWDRAIEQVDALIERKQKRLHGLRQRLLTGEVRFPEFHEPWENVQIGSLLKRVYRYVDWDDDATYDLVSIKRDSQGMVFRESLKGSEIKTKTLNSLKEGDFVISRMQVVHGATAYVSEEFDGMKASDSYIILVPRDENRIDTEFFAELSKLPYLYHIAFTSSYGVHIEKMTFNPDWYFESEVHIPPSVEEQRKIVAFLNRTKNEIYILEEKRAALTRQKKGLMQRLPTGAVRTI